MRRKNNRKTKRGRYTQYIHCKITGKTKCIKHAPKITWYFPEEYQIQGIQEEV